MPKTLFILTHLDSGWEKLARALERDPRVHVFNTSIGYHHAEDLIRLTSLPHRHHNSAAVWCDVVLHNKDFTLKRHLDTLGLVFWANPAAGCDPAYLAFRLEGMRQYWRRAGRPPWNPPLEADGFLRAVLG